MRAVLPNLKPGTDYEIQIRAISGIYRSSEWSPRFKLKTASYLTKPQIPTQVTWTVDGSTFAGTWKAVTLDVDSQPVNIVAYKIQLTPVANPTLFATVTVPFGDNIISYVLPYEDNIALFGTAQGALKFKVRAVDVRGTLSDWSDEYTAQNAAPAAPTDFVLKGVADAITMTWKTSPATDLAGYRIYTGATETFTPSAANRIYQGESLSYNYGTSTYAEQYFKLCAYDEFGIESVFVSGKATPRDPFVVDIIAPQKPTATATITNNANGVEATALVNWTPSTGSWPSDLSGFNIRWSVSGANVWSNTTVDAQTSSTTVSLFRAYTNYDFQVRAFDNNFNYSAWSDTYVATSPANATPSNVSGLTGLSTKDSISYSWSAVSDQDIKNYELQISKSNTFTSPSTYNVGTSTSLAIAGLDSATTYYARVRAIDVAGLTSAAYSATFSIATKSAVSSDITDALNTYTTNTVTPGLNGKNKITHSIDAPGTTPNIEGDTWIRLDNYTDRRIIAQFRGTGGTGWQNETIRSEFIAYLEASKIQADSTFTNNLNVKSIFTLGDINTQGAMKSYDYQSGTKGFVLSSAGLEINDGIVRVGTLKGGTLGGTSGAGVINIAAGTSLVFNGGAGGGYLKSSTYTGTTQNTNPSGAGFYLGDDGIRIDQGKIKAEAFVGGSFSGGTINLTGAGTITGPGYTLSSSGLTVLNGDIRASALNIVIGGGNLIQNSALKSIESWSGNTGAIKQTPTGPTLGTGVVDFSAGSGYTYILQNPTLQPGTYVFSCYVKATATGITSQSGAGVMVEGATATSRVAYSGNVPTEWSRSTAVFTLTSATQVNLLVTNTYGGSTSGTGSILLTQPQLEVGNIPTAYSPMPAETVSGITRVDGGMIRTGAIISNATETLNGVAVPRWSIDMAGAAVFSSARIRGNTIVGAAPGTSEENSWIQSANFVQGSIGWKILSNGDSFFRNTTITGLITGSEIRGGKITSATTIEGALQTDTRANRGLLVDSSGLKAYNSSSAITFQLNGETGAIKMSGNIDASGANILGANITGTSSINGVSVNGGTITGSLIQSSVSGARVYMQEGYPGLNFDTGQGKTGQIFVDANSITLFSPGNTSYFLLRDDGYIGMSGNSRLEINSEQTVLRSITMLGSARITGISASFQNIEATNQLSVSNEAFFHYNNAGTNAGFNANKKLVSVASTREVKKYIHPLARDFDYETIISLEPKMYRFKAEMEMGDDYVSGFIAEEAEELGLDAWVVYNDIGKPVSFRYMEYTAALQFLAREQDKKIKDLSARLDKYENLEQRLTALENQS